ncbi:M23 family metallopeptidase [Paenibacillus sp. y28]|uniref:M23 family metallopeptidase n=1 Tax=Paenibacillus sp. y28 TaxID=3129110 RepID=UPI00301AA897
MENQRPPVRSPDSGRLFDEQSGSSNKPVRGRESTYRPVLPVHSPDKRLNDPEYAWKHRDSLRVLQTQPMPYLDEFETPGQMPPIPASPRGWIAGLRWKLTLAVLVYVLLWGLFRLDMPVLLPVQQAVRTALTEPMNRVHMQQWYRELFAGTPGLLPALEPKPIDDAQKVSTTVTTRFAAPVIGTVIQPYELPGSPGMWLETEAGAVVKAVDTGRVVAVQSSPEQGWTVTIQHAKGYRTVYGGIAQTAWKTNDWIKMGEALGKVKSTAEVGGRFYFAVTKDQNPLNPTDVVSFD